MCTVNSKNKEVMCYQTCVQLYFNTRSSFTALGMQCHRHTSLLSKEHFTNTLQSTIPLWGGFFYLTTGHFSFVNFCCTITLTCFNILQHYLNVNRFSFGKSVFIVKAVTKRQIKILNSQGKAAWHGFQFLASLWNPKQKSGIIHKDYELLKWVLEGSGLAIHLNSYHKKVQSLSSFPNKNRPGCPSPAGWGGKFVNKTALGRKLVCLMTAMIYKYQVIPLAESRLILFF